MNYLRRFLFISLCFNITTLIVNCDTFYNLVDNFKYFLSDENYTIWINYIGNDNEVLVDGEFVTLQNYLKSSNVTHLYEIKINNLNYSISSTKKVFSVSNTLYTFLKCKYSTIIARLLKFIDKSIESCQCIQHSAEEENLIKDCIQLTLDNFKKVKPYFEKTIFQLFYFNNLSQNLKSSDQTLLISLLTINTFLYREDKTQNDQQKLTHIYIVDVKHFNKLITQLIYSLENFLCKNCNYSFKDLDHNNGQLIYSTYHNIKSSSISDIKTQISEFMAVTYYMILKYLNDLKLKNVEVDFKNNSGMYDLQYILLKEVFSNINGIDSLLKEFKNKTKINKFEIIEDVENSYNIIQVLKYQIYLIEFIGSIFSAQIQNIVTLNNNSFTHDIFVKIKTLIDCFIQYTDNLIPENYPPSLLRLVNILKDALLTDINQSAFDKVLILSTKTQQLLKRNSTIYTIKENVELCLKVSLPDLIKKIIGFHAINSFKQTFEILLQEFGTPDDYYYYLIQVDDREKIKDSYDATKIETCENSVEIRKYLLLLWSLIDIIKTNNYFKLPSSDNTDKKLLPDYLTPSYDNIFQYMAHVYKNTNDLRLQMILLPVLIHFKNTEWILYDGTKRIFKKLTIIQRTLILAVNSLQYYEVNNCEFVELNQSIIDEITADLDKIKNTDKINNIHLKIVFKTKIYNYDNFKNSKYINDVIDTYIFTDILNGMYMINVQFSWYGIRASMLTVSTDVLQNIVDYQRILRFQTLILNFLVAKIYTQLDYIFKFPIRLTKNKIQAIRKYLGELNSLEYTLPLVLDLQDICQSYSNIFEDEDISYKNIQLFRNQIKDRIKAYGVFELDGKHEFKTFNDCYATLKYDIETLKKYLMYAPHRKLLIFVDDYAVPITWKDYTI